MQPDRQPANKSRVDNGRNDFGPSEPRVPSLKWYRLKRQGMIGGVCAGLAVHTGIPVEIVRIAFVAATLIGGWGLLIYLGLMLVMPVLPPGETIQGRDLLKTKKQTPPPSFPDDSIDVDSPKE